MKNAQKAKTVKRRKRSPFLIVSYSAPTALQERVRHRLPYGDQTRFDAAVKYFTKLGVVFKGYNTAGEVVAEN